NERVFQTNEEAVKAGIYEEFVDSMLLKGLSAREVPREPAGRAETPAREPAEVPSPGAVSPETVMGYRVQLGAFNEQEHAERFAGRARERLASFMVYVRYYHPLWKVQVGDCRTREEAERLCDTLRGRGFPDAWVIQSGIQR
ncbi:MAG: SPOR domain-containing protein, partial [Candidatus Glassbacteria bacterium]|nr:SPOR domain-containing protein [Candidatus Glassbacteria bacterium]